MKREIALLLAGLALLTGCEERTELGERAVIQAAGINADEKGCEVNALLFSSNGSGLVDASKENVIRADGSGETLAAAIDDVSINDGRAAYLSNIRLIIFGEGYERADIASALNTLYYDMGCGLDTLLACADNPKEITALGFTEGVTSAEKLAELVENAALEGLAPKTTLLDALCAIESGSTFLLPYFTVEENGSMTEQGVAAIPSGSRSVSNGTLGKRLSAEETAGALLVSGENDKITISFSNGKSERCCEAYNVKVRVQEDGSAKISARLRAKNGSRLSGEDKDGAMERLGEIVRAGL